MRSNKSEASVTQEPLYLACIRVAHSRIDWFGQTIFNIIGSKRYQGAQKVLSQEAKSWRLMVQGLNIDWTIVSLFISHKLILMTHGGIKRKKIMKSSSENVRVILTHLTRGMLDKPIFDPLHFYLLLHRTDHIVSPLKIYEIRISGHVVGHGYFCKVENTFPILSVFKAI